MLSTTTPAAPPPDVDTPPAPLTWPLADELPPTGVDSHDVLARRTQRLLGGRRWGLPC